MLPAMNCAALALRTYIPSEERMEGNFHALELFPPSPHVSLRGASHDCQLLTPTPQWKR